MSGSVPIASRGYVITADFRSLHGRRPDEQEYRYLRNVVDGLEVDAPKSVALEAVLRENRDVLGRSFDAASSSYADVVHEVFEGFMEQSSRLIGSSMSQGCWPIIAPQGTFHSRLTPGRIGAVQLAVRLGVPIIPVAVGGMREAFAKGHSLRGRPATIPVRFGAPQTIELPTDHQPFHVQSERQNRDTLQRETHRVMTCINAMLPERCQWGDDVNGDGLQGVNRFL